MDLYPSVLEYLASLPVLKEWQVAASLLDRAASSKPRDWRLPALSCEAVGGTMEEALPACAATACAQVSIILIDDLLDEDPRGAYHQLGVAQTANVAAALQAMAFQAIHDSAAKDAVKLAADKSLGQMIATVAFGQYLDTQNPNDEVSYWRVVQTKSAPFFGAIFELGALYGGAPAEVVDAIRKIGCLFGEMIQIHDDINDCMTDQAGPDWIQGRFSLPILFAQTVDHPERDRFLVLSKKASDLEALREAQSILIRCGSISYCFYQLMHRYDAAQTLLADVSLRQPDRMKELLSDLVAPVQKLLDVDSAQAE